MNKFIARFLNGQTVKIFAAIIGVLVAVSGILTLTRSEEQIVLERPESAVQSGNLVSVQKEIAGRELYYYIITLANEQGQLRCVIEPGYSSAFDYDAFVALVPTDQVVEVTAETVACVGGSDLYPVLSVASAGEEYLSYQDTVKLIGTVYRTGSVVMGWMFVIVGLALVIPLVILFFNGPAPASGKVIRTRRSSLPINSKYVK